jgi:hypothetical protein
LPAGAMWPSLRVISAAIVEKGMARMNREKMTHAIHFVDKDLFISKTSFVLD